MSVLRDAMFGIQGAPKRWCRMFDMTRTMGHEFVYIMVLVLGMDVVHAELLGIMQPRSPFSNPYDGRLAWL